MKNLKGLLNVIIIFSIVILIVCFLNLYDNKKFENEPLCKTSTKSYNIYTGSDGQKMIDFSFTVDGKEIKSFHQLNEKMVNEINKTKEIFIIYICDKPTKNRLYFESNNN